jgi:hypothetical protein
MVAVNGIGMRALVCIMCAVERQSGVSHVLKEEKKSSYTVLQQ